MTKLKFKKSRLKIDDAAIYKASTKHQVIQKINLIWPCTTSDLTENRCPGAPQKLEMGLIQ